MLSAADACTAGLAPNAIAPAATAPIGFWIFTVTPLVRPGVMQKNGTRGSGLETKNGDPSRTSRDRAQLVLSRGICTGRQHFDDGETRMCAGRKDCYRSRR